MRSAQVNRNTLETKIDVQLNLDGNGKSTFDTGLPFLDHMLDQVARHEQAEQADAEQAQHRHRREKGKGE